MTTGVKARMEIDLPFKRLNILVISNMLRWIVYVLVLQNGTVVIFTIDTQSTVMIVSRHIRFISQRASKVRRTNMDCCAIRRLWAFNWDRLEGVFRYFGEWIVLRFTNCLFSLPLIILELLCHIGWNSVFWFPGFSYLVAELQEFIVILSLEDFPSRLLPLKSVEFISQDVNELTF